MSYQIGQLRDSDFSSESSFFTSISFTTIDSIVVETSFSDIAFQDKGIVPSSIVSNQNYYLNFTVQRNEEGTFVDPYDLTVDDLDFSVALLKNGSSAGTYEIIQTIDSFNVLPYPQGETEEAYKKVNYEVMFSPITSDWTCIGFILKRKRYDYRGTGAERVLNLTINKFGYLKNILLQQEVSKIGVQAKPGFLMCINGEPIRVGRSGVYEINNGFIVNFIGIASFEDEFILDYAWNE